MKKFIQAIALAVLMTASSAFAQTGPVLLNNYDSNNAIFAPGGSLASGSVFVQLFAGTDAGNLVLVSNSGGQNTFSLLEPGFFDSGFGYTGLPNNSSGYFRLVAWSGGSTFDTAQIRGSVDWTQTVGNQNPGSPLLPPPTSAVLNNPVLNMAVVPEPTTIALGVLGGLGLLARRRKNA
ncbi:MAG TPA: PEP-CTERM sorting domain-containing protein [Verrucomicrobiae bacterium]